ncbi:hypothetical protein [Fundidesulfovibrio terrae]|uniref:hypothetical protein n=1 Tax=Fundidesulfovibrio terrae TaxID=2922866 RepID=UPI001FAFFB71|nr:hypothetical protein [Fundidesulfovibrio terrae]
MGDDSINSPGQLRLFEVNNGWLPDNTGGNTTTSSEVGTNTDTGSTSGRADTGSTNANPSGTDTGETKLYTWQQSAQKAGLANGDYFTHDNKLYQRRDGGIVLVTGDPNGDVKLDEEQTGQLEKDIAAKAEREKAEKEGPIYTDQVPGGVIDPNDPSYAAPRVDPTGKRADSAFNRLPPDARAGLVGLTTKYAVKPFVGKVPVVGDWLADGIGLAAGTAFKIYDHRIPELENKDKQ